jgi:hypothetical protein
MNSHCYLCGAKVDPTRHRDHIPPKAFFPTPRPADLITVPCCKPCNRAASLDDEAFKAWFSIAVGASPTAAATMVDASLPHVFHRSAKFSDYTISLVERGMIEYLDGPREVDGIVIPKDRLTRFMTRIVKGLLCHYEPEYDYSSDAFTVKLLAISQTNLDLLAPFQAKGTFDKRGDGVVCFRREVRHDKQEGLWLITFFEAANVLVHHRGEEPKGANQ